MTLHANESQPVDRQPIEVDAVRRVMAEVENLLDQVEGLVFMDHDGRKNSHHAAISRELLLAADRLDLAASLVKVQYWRTRGVPDPTNGENR